MVGIWWPPLPPVSIASCLRMLYPNHILINNNGSEVMIVLTSILVTIMISEIQTCVSKQLIEEQMVFIIFINSF